MRRCLFGPVSPEFSCEKLQRHRASGQCLAFDLLGAADLRVAHEESWETLCRRLPRDWQPEFIALYLPYNTVPQFVFSCPLPVVALAPEWDLQWHYYRRRLSKCDLMVTDPHGKEVMGRAGLGPIIAGNLAGCSPRLLALPFPQDGRDIDVLFVGNLNTAVQSQRGYWLSQLAQLTERWNVVVRTGAFGDRYAELLGRARIVFSHNRQGGSYRRAYEAMAAGALLFQEAGNPQIEQQFTDRRDCVFFDCSNLQPLFNFYLGNETERRKLAEAGRQQAQRCTFADFWEKTLDDIDAGWDALCLRRRQRPVAQPPHDDLLTRCWQSLSATSRDASLLIDLEPALNSNPGAADVHQFIGLITALTSSADMPLKAEMAAMASQRAVECQPQNVVARASWAIALAQVGRCQQALEQAAQTRSLLNQPQASAAYWFDTPLFPPIFDWMRVEWERAAWQHAGNSEEEVRTKRALLRWRMHTLTAELTGDIVHCYEALHAAPWLTPARSTLGCALALTNHPQEAVPYLASGLAENPLDHTSARMLRQIFVGTHNRHAEEELAHQRRLLARAIPQVIPIEDWFREGPVQLEAVPIVPQRVPATAMEPSS